jgi:hypothetical protein
MAFGGTEAQAVSIYIQSVSRVGGNMDEAFCRRILADGEGAPELDDASYVLALVPVGGPDPVDCLTPMARHGVGGMRGEKKFKMVAL